MSFRLVGSTLTHMFISTLLLYFQLKLWSQRGEVACWHISSRCYAVSHETVQHITSYTLSHINTFSHTLWYNHTKYPVTKLSRTCEYLTIFGVYITDSRFNQHFINHTRGKMFFIILCLYLSFCPVCSFSSDYVSMPMYIHAFTSTCMQYNIVVVLRFRRWRWRLISLEKTSWLAHGFDLSEDDLSSISLTLLSIHICIQWQDKVETTGDSQDAGAAGIESGWAQYRLRGSTPRFV